MKVLIIITLFSLVTGDIIESIKEKALQFSTFIKAFKKNYANDEEIDRRFEAFVKSLDSVRRLNQLNKHATFGVNKFSDLTKIEFLRLYTGLKPHLLTLIAPDCIDMVDADVFTNLAPREYDWSKLNKVTRVKNQRRCGSCWAFSAIGNVESQFAIKYNETVEFSEQQLVDCDSRSNGCGGGLPTNAFRTLQKEGGVMLSKDYPYSADDGLCKFNYLEIRAKLVGCKKYDLTLEDNLKEVLYLNGPISIAVDATSLRHYTGGILDHCHFSSLNHAVLLVGYGEENNVPYWNVKNSWGKDYGENGYLRLLRGNNTCGVLNSYASTSVLA